MGIKCSKKGVGEGIKIKGRKQNKGQREAQQEMWPKAINE